MKSSAKPNPMPLHEDEIQLPTNGFAPKKTLKMKMKIQK